MVPFGSPKGEVADLVTRAYGPPSSENLVADCNGTELFSVDWGGLTLYLAPGVADPATAGFLGWDVDSPKPAISTTDGVGFGAPIVMVVASSGDVVQDSTFDLEFFDGASSGSAGEFSVDLVWAGESCVTR